VTHTFESLFLMVTIEQDCNSFR